MPDIVTLDEVREWARVDADDDTLVILIAAATESALATAQGYDPETEPPATLKLAILAHVVRAYDNRDAVDAPETNLRLLGPLRALDV